MKCNDCYLRLHCDEQTEFICKYNDYCKYMQEPSNKDISAIEKVQYENDDDIIIRTTPEYFARIAEDEMNVKRATDFLNKLGIQVKTEYGNYRPTYDVLRDIGDAMSRA